MTIQDAKTISDEIEKGAKKIVLIVPNRKDNEHRTTKTTRIHLDPSPGKVTSLPRAGYDQNGKKN